MGPNFVSFFEEKIRTPLFEKSGGGGGADKKWNVPSGNVELEWNMMACRDSNRHRDLTSNAIMHNIIIKNYLESKRITAKYLRLSSFCRLASICVISCSKSHYHSRL